MEILGLVFVGTSSSRRAEMAAFARDVLGMTPELDPGIAGDLFALPDGSRFAVVDKWEPGEGGRTIGLLVRDLDAAVAELAAAGIETDEVGENDRHRYVHFIPPDGQLYELVEEKS